MFKKSIYLLALVAGLASCTEDYTDWANPQSNAANEAVAAFTMTVSPGTTTVDFASETADSLQLFSTNLTEGQTDAYTVAFYSEELGTSDTLTVSPSGKVATADLQQTVVNIYGKAPQARTLTTTVSAEVTIATADGNIIATKRGEPFTFTGIPDAPLISQNYYIVGGALNWAASAASKEQKFSHSSADVYEDPIFTIVFPAAEGQDTYFAIGDDEACDAVGNGDWSKLLGTTLGDGKNGIGVTEHLNTRTVIGNDGSFRVPASYGATSIKVVIDMMNYTYTITPIKGTPAYYIVGAMQGWSDSQATCGFYPTADKQYSYTTQFNGDGNLKIWAAEDFGNWSASYGTAVDGDQSASGALVVNAGAIKCPEPGAYYTLSLDFSTNTYAWTKLADQSPTTYSAIGLIGDFNGWGSDLALTEVTPHNWYGEAVIESAGALKFRANGGWDINWGTDIDLQEKSYGTGTQNGANITCPAGTYKVFFNDITGQFSFVAQ